MRVLKNVLRLRGWIGILVGLLATAGNVRAQDSASACGNLWRSVGGEVSGPDREWRRAAEIAGLTPLAAISRRESSPDATLSVCGDRIPRVLSPWLNDGYDAEALRLLPVRNLTVFNSAYPDERNNGAMWAGRGMSSAVSLGMRASYGPLTVQLAPVFAWQANADVRLLDTTSVGPYSGFTQRIRRIDVPQRFGTSSFTTVAAGQSAIRLDVASAALGVSTENLWWGPGQRNSIILSNTAAGFPHVFLGTDKPLKTPIGRFRMEGVWGRLDESEYFDTVPNNDERLFSGLTFTYEPRFLPGLQLGFNRVFTFLSDSVSTSDFIFRLFQPALKKGLITEEDPTGSDPDDQIGSLFARWVLQPAQFEVYAEWAKADHNVDWWDLLHEPDHGQAYTLGFQKIIDRPDYWIRVNGELTHLNASTTFRSGRGGGAIVTYYVHPRYCVFEPGPIHAPSS